MRRAGGEPGMAGDEVGGAGRSGLDVVGDPTDEPVRGSGAVVNEPHECDSWIGCPCDTDFVWGRQ